MQRHEGSSEMNRLISAAILLAVVALLLLWSRGVPAQTSTVTQSCLDDTGKTLFSVSGESTIFYWRCVAPVMSGIRTYSIIRRIATTAGVTTRTEAKIVASSGVGVWTWIAPTMLENGDILTDLSHYNVYRQRIPEAPTVWAQVDAKATRFIIPMGPESFDACFWVTAVRKPGTSPPVESDKSNTVCMDAQGQLNSISS